MVTADADGQQRQPVEVHTFGVEQREEREVPEVEAVGDLARRRRRPDWPAPGRGSPPGRSPRRRAARRRRPRPASSPPENRKPVGPSSRPHRSTIPSSAAHPKTWAARRAVVLDSSQAVMGRSSGHAGAGRRAGGPATIPGPPCRPTGGCGPSSKSSRSGTGTGQGPAVAGPHGQADGQRRADQDVLAAGVGALVQPGDRGVVQVGPAHVGRPRPGHRPRPRPAPATAGGTVAAVGRGGGGRGPPGARRCRTAPRSTATTCGRGARAGPTGRSSSTPRR